MDLTQFYNEFARLYHLTYPDWDRGIERQALMLNSIIRESWGSDVTTVLDVACGIGTQALGLAKLGYQVTASDLSPEAVKRAKAEAQRRGLSVSFSVADFRHPYAHHVRQFDLAIACDNAVPHLLTDEDILGAFQQFLKCVRPGGGCLISVRDYEKEDLTRQQVKMHGIREENGVRYVVFQTWDPHGPLYDLTMYFVEDKGGAQCTTHTLRSQYYAVGVSRLVDLMALAGFEGVKRLDGRFFQPVVIGTRPI